MATPKKPAKAPAKADPKAKGKKDDAIEAVGELFAEILGIEGTQLLSDVEMLHRNKKVPTPLTYLNDAFGGGFPLGCMVEAAGDSKAGKSSFCYQTAGLFQLTFPEGVVIILDTEASTDVVRMKLQGVDPRRVTRVPATTVEAGFKALFAILEKIRKVEQATGTRIPVLILWDTIGAALTEAQAATGDMNAGGMNEKNRILKIELARVFLEIAKMDVLVMLLNQASMQGFGTYQGPSLGSSGGQALKHDVHIKLWFDGKKQEMADQYMVAGKMGELTIQKSKICPEFKKLPYWIDSREGGIILDDPSLWAFAKELGLVAGKKNKNGGNTGRYYLLGMYPPGTDPEQITTLPENDLAPMVLGSDRNDPASPYSILRNSVTEYFYRSSTYMRHVYQDINYRGGVWAQTTLDMSQALPQLAVATEEEQVTMGTQPEEVA